MASQNYPYRARALMRFKAQDGSISLTSDQIVTVTAASDEDGDWVDVTNEDGQTGSVPAGFLVGVEEEPPVVEGDQRPTLEQAPTSQDEEKDEVAGREEDTGSGRIEASEDVEPALPVTEEKPQKVSKDPPTETQEPKTSSSVMIDKLGDQRDVSPKPPPQTSQTSHPVSHQQTPPKESAPPTPPAPANVLVEPQNEPTTAPVASSKQPPPPAAKPGSLRDRIAMFNKPVPAAGPPSASAPRPKPPLARKPMAIPPPAPPIETEEPPNSSAPTAGQPSGMSAADAEESVRAGGSLKDRIKLLQQQRQSAAPEPAPPTAPKPKREWKRPQVAEGEQTAILPGMMPPPPPQKLIPRGPSEDRDSETNRPEDLNTARQSTAEGEEEEGDEEEEAARRRRIAERMAKLGGAKMGFGFPGPPPLAPKPTAVTAPRKSEEEPDAEPQAETPAGEPSQVLPPERVALPPMPRRAGPPRRTTPIPSSAAASLEDNSRPQESPEAQSNTLSPAPPTNPEASEEPVPPGEAPSLNVSEASKPLDNSIPGEEASHPTEPATEDETKPAHEVHQPTDSPESPVPPPQQSSAIGRQSPEPAQLQSSAIEESDRAEEAQPYAEAPTVSTEEKSEVFSEMNPRTLDQTSESTEAFPEQRKRLQGSVSELPTVQDDVAHEVQDSPFDEEEHEPAPGQNFSESYEPEEEDNHPVVHEPEHDGLEAEKLRDVAPAPPSRPTAETVLDDDEFQQGEQPSENAELLTRENNSAFKAMLSGALGMPPLSPRPTGRKPSGPREPKSPFLNPQSGGEADGSSASPHRSPSPGALEGDLNGNVVAIPTADHSDYERQPGLTAEASSQDQVRSDSRGSHEAEQHNEERDTEQPREEEPLEDDDEDEETARRRRLAERMAKMGGRSMMGPMVPMFSPGGSGSGLGRRPSSNRPPPQQPATQSTAARKLPSPPSVPPPPRLPSNDSLPRPSVMSPPLRPAPQAILPDAVGDCHEEPEEVEQPSPIPPKRPSQAHILTNYDVQQPDSPSTLNTPLSPSGRPPIPSGYQDSSNRPGTRSQSNSSWTGEEAGALNPPVEWAQEGFDQPSSQPPSYPPPHPPSHPPPQPKRNLPELPQKKSPSSGYAQRNEGRESPSHQSRSGSFESSRSGNRRRSGLIEQDSRQAPTGSRLHSEAPPQGSYTVSRPGFKARDLDLASERWWRYRPVAPPSSVKSMNDVLFRLQGSSNIQKGKSIYQYELVVIRDDYSKTVVNIKFDDNEDESGTEMTQIHYPPPEPYEISALQELGQTLGPQIVARAKAKEDEKGFKGEDGTSFVKAIIKSLEVALEPVGQTYGELVYKCEIQDVKGAHPEIEVKDDIRPGDIVASYGATFKGKGIGHGSMNLGTVSNPHLGVVADNDVKKNKFKAYGISHGKVELISYRLDEMKSGCIKVFRVLDKDFLENHE